MLFCPFPGRPRVSQWFGSNPGYYAKYGMKGHNGIDIAIPVGRIVYAPHEGVISLKDNGQAGYGKHILITSLPYKTGKRRQTALAHLSSFGNLQEGQFISARDATGLSGNTGDSTGPHLHWTYKILDEAGNVLDVNNGFHGAVNLAPMNGVNRTSFIQLWNYDSLLQ